MRSSAGVGMTPPKVLGAPKPTSSVMMSSTLGAPSGGTMRGGHHAFDWAAFSLITPPNFPGGGGSCTPSRVIVALGDPAGGCCMGKADLLSAARCPNESALVAAIKPRIAPVATTARFADNPRLTLISDGLLKFFMSAALVSERGGRAKADLQTGAVGRKGRVGVHGEVRRRFSQKSGRPQAGLAASQRKNR